MIERDDPSVLVRVWLLGAFHVERRQDETTWKTIEPSAWGNSYARSLLTYLLCVSNRKAPRSAISDALWPERDLALADKYLNNASSRLYRLFQQEGILTPFGSHGRAGYELAGQEVLWTDIDACEALLREAERLGRTSSQALPLLEQASRHFERGSMLEGESGQWALASRAEKESVMRCCLLWLADAYEAQGMLWHVRGQYRRLIETHPLDEDLLCRLFAMLHRHGMTHDVRKAYEEAKHRFSEYGLSLSGTTKALAEKLLHEPRSLETYLVPFTPSNTLVRNGEYPLREDEQLKGVTKNTQLSPEFPMHGQVVSPLDAASLPQSVVLHYATGQHMVFTASGGVPALYPLALQAYEDVLTLAWEAFYTSWAERSASAVHHWLLYLTQEIIIARGSVRDQLLAIRCRFLQLSSVLARDRAEFKKALDGINEAITLAVQLQNAELLASSLYRRAKVHAKQHHYHRAVRDLEEALPYANRSRDPLRCYICMFLAEVYSLLDPTSPKLLFKSLELLDEVDKAVRVYSVLEGDGSFVKVDVSGLYMIRGDVLRRSGEIKEAQKALFIVQESLPKEFIRWQGNLYVSEAQLALADGDIDSSCKLAYNALDFIEATRSRSNKAEVLSVYQNIWNVEPSHPRLKDLGARLGVA
jgi:DNA-binding SARP family transcriptional activator